MLKNYQLIHEERVVKEQLEHYTTDILRNNFERKKPQNFVRDCKYQKFLSTYSIVVRALYTD